MEFYIELKSFLLQYKGKYLILYSIISFYIDVHLQINNLLEALIDQRPSNRLASYRASCFT